MKWHYAAAVAAVVLTQTTAAFGEDPQPTTPDAKLEAIQKELKDAQAAYVKAVQALPNTPEAVSRKGQLFTESRKKRQEGIAAALELAKTDPKSETAWAALQWVLTSPQIYDLQDAKPALNLATENYAAKPEIGEIIASVDRHFSREMRGGPDAKTALYQAVVKNNPDRTARAQAALALANQANGIVGWAEYKKRADVEKLAADAATAYEAVIKDYGDCPLLLGYQKETIGKLAKQKLFELQHLRVGMVAPEIEGEDLDGRKFKLSDYRGKVVMLDFWASWVGSYRGTIPYKRSLVKRMEGKPFVLLGVNNDGDKDALKKVMEKEGITWRSWRNGASIAQAWIIPGWPTTYLIDAKGVIREKNLAGIGLDDTVDELVAEVGDEKKPEKKPSAPKRIATVDPPLSSNAKLAAIQKKVKDAEAACSEAAEALPVNRDSSEERAELRRDFYQKQVEGFMAAVDYAKADPKSDGAFEAVEWVLTNPQLYSYMPDLYLPAGKAALELATEHHAANPKIGKTVVYVDSYFLRGQGELTGAAEAFFKAVAAKNPDRAVRGQAVLELADQADHKFAEAESSKSPDAETLAAEAEKAFEAVVKDYGDCTRLILKNGETFGEIAKHRLFELQRLRVGMVAPEIEGEDLDGAKFKLSEYRGKVVLLDFWGNW
jgi:peroxiredoxin